MHLSIRALDGRLPRNILICAYKYVSIYFYLSISPSIYVCIQVRIAKWNGKPHACFMCHFNRDPLCDISIYVSFQFMCHFNLCVISICVSFQFVCHFNLCVISIGILYVIYQSYRGLCCVCVGLCCLYVIDPLCDISII